ncbi:MAG TPA: hypothetical protein VI432_01580 [Candidatus Paceibacterota bacterium]
MRKYLSIIILAVVIIAGLIIMSSVYNYFYQMKAEKQTDGLRGPMGDPFTSGPTEPPPGR